MMDPKGKGKQTRDSDDSTDDDEDDADNEELERRQAAAVVWFNQASPDELIELTCTLFCLYRQTVALTYWFI